MEEEIYLDFTEKKCFVHLKAENFKKIKSLKMSSYLNVPDKIKVGGNRLNLEDLISYNQIQKKITKKCSNCSLPLLQKFNINMYPKVLIFYLNRYDKKPNQVGNKSDLLVKFPFKLNLENKEYKLYAVANSYDRKHAHSDAFCYSENKKLWFKFDDTRIL